MGDITELPELTPPDTELIRNALVAAVDCPYFPDWEFHTLLGLHRLEIAEMLAV